MARYFCDLKSGEKDFVDDQGTEYPDFVSAKADAVRFFGETLKDKADTFTGQNEWEVTVRDEAGLTLLTFVFSMLESSAIKNTKRSWCSTSPTRPEAYR